MKRNNINKDAQLTAEVIGLIMRQQALHSEYGFSGIWSETAAGFETYGKHNLVWTTFVRDHNTEYWYKRVRNIIIRRRKEQTL